MVFTNVKIPRSHIVRRDQYETTLVKRGATLGANCTVVCGVTIGEHAFIGAGAVVTRDVPAYALVYGNPGRVRGYACDCGETLRVGNKTETSQVVCDACGISYNLRDGELQRASAAVRR